MDIDALVAITDAIDTYMYTYFLVFLLLGAGLYFTIRTRGVQFTHIKDMFKAITEKKHVEGRKSVSSFQAMMVSTASRVGTGNIAGVATAIVVFFGAQSSLTLAWNLADIFMGIQATINIVVILILGKWAFVALDDYKEQRARGLDPVFVADKFPGMPATECWHEAREELRTIDENIAFSNLEE